MMFCRLVMSYDQAAILSLAEMQVKETLPHITFDLEVTRQTFWESVDRADPTIFVVEDKGEVIGYLMALMRPYAMARGVFASQEVIYVRPCNRGSRAAALLIKGFLAWADIIGAREVYMGIANGYQPDRTARLFEHFGFALVGHHLRKVPHHDDVHFRSAAE